MKSASLLALAALAFGIALGTEYTRLAAGSGAPALSCRGSARVMARLEMLFGTARPHGVAAVVPIRRM